MSDASQATEHYQKLVSTYLSAPTNEMYQPRLFIQSGAAQVEIDARESLHHSAGAVHGSHYFKLLDDAAFFAVNSLVKEVFVLTVSLNTHFLRPVSKGTMRAEGRVVHETRRLFWAESVLTDSEGHELGRANGTFIRSRIPLDPSIGYR